MVARITLALASMLMLMLAQSSFGLPLGEASSESVLSVDQAFHECCLQVRLSHPRSACAACLHLVALATTAPPPDGTKSTLDSKCARGHARCVHIISNEKESKESTS
ncbi:Hypothetical predicted protein [Drosophila guanche]|uniref:Uncharacterized protein n=1 Tax=Drosophila guanche TaxID=7266 RepID=A0A3B0JWB3_DROGU|nr:Hypothetical predicted protein [Drosophila guanche]